MVLFIMLYKVVMSFSSNISNTRKLVSADIQTLGGRLKNEVQPNFF